VGVEVPGQDKIIYQLRKHVIYYLCLDTAEDEKNAIDNSTRIAIRTSHVNWLEWSLQP
jgi:hypothetical protein